MLKNILKSLQVWIFSIIMLLYVFILILFIIRGKGLLLYGMYSFCIIVYLSLLILKINEIKIVYIKDKYKNTSFKIKYKHIKLYKKMFCGKNAEIEIYNLPDPEELIYINYSYYHINIVRCTIPEEHEIIIDFENLLRKKKLHRLC